MNYIYDIVLNFNSFYYEFFEWNDDDFFLNVKKIPIFRINTDTYLDFKYNSIIINSDFISLIGDSCYISNDGSKRYICLVSNGKEVMGIEVDEKSNLVGRSSIIFDEEEDILEDIYNLDDYSIDYIVKNVYKGDKIYYRSIRDKKDYLENYFNNVNDIDLFRYIYYDVFEKEEKELFNIKNKLLLYINNNTDNIDKLYYSIKGINKVR